MFILPSFVCVNKYVKPNHVSSLVRLTNVRYGSGGSNRQEACFREAASKGCKSLLRCGPCARHNYMDIRCKVALVTGGGCGLGFAAANELLCQQAYRVIIAHQNVENGIRAAEDLNAIHGKDKACYFHMDFGKPKDFIALFEYSHEKFGGIDILVNSTWPLPNYKWEHDIDANLKNILRGNILARKWMTKKKRSMTGGVVINIASTSGLEEELIAPVFTGTKHGVVGLSKCLGSPEHFRKTGVRVVCLCPGKDNPLEPPELQDPELIKKFSQGMPLQPTSKVGHALTYLIRYAPSGSVWVVENSALYKTKMPPRHTYSETVDLL